MKSSHTAFTSWWVLLAAAGGMMIGKTPFASAASDAFKVVDFSVDGSQDIHGYELNGGALIKENAPGGVARALRIELSGQYARLPGVDISPSKMIDCTLVIGLYLESIPSGARGWVLGHEVNGYDRTVIMHDSRFNNMGMALGYASSVWETKTLPTVHKWLHIVAVFRQGKDSYFFVDGTQAPIPRTGNNNGGSPDLYVGSAIHTDHQSDCWIKEVRVYERALDESEVQNLHQNFMTSLEPPDKLAKNEYQISLIDESIDVAFNDSRINSEIVMNLNITTDNVSELSDPIKVFDYDTCKTKEYNSLMLSTFVAGDDNVTNNGVFSTVPVGVNLNTTDIVSFNNSDVYPGFFNAQDESVILQFCLKPTLGSSEVYNATTGDAVQTYISYTKIKVQINLNMTMDFSSAAVSIKEDAPKQSTEEVTVDYTLDAYECDAATKVRIENPVTKTQNSLVTVCIESTFDDIIIGDIKELTLTQSTSGLTSIAIANSNANSITEVSNIGTKKAAVSTRLVGAFFTDLADDTESTIDIAGIAVLMFGSGARRLVRIGNGAHRQGDTAAADRVLEEETVDDPLGEFAVSMGISAKNVGGAASAATKAKKVVASLFSAAIGVLVL